MFYSMHRGKVDWHEDLLFPNTASDLVVSRCTFARTGIRVQLLASGGHLAQMEIDDIVPELTGDKVTDVRVLADLLAIPSARGNVRVYLDRIHLPKDYPEFLQQQFTGVVKRGLKIYRAPEMRRVLTEKENYCIIAELEGKGVFCLREDDPSGKLFWIDFESPFPQPLGDSLLEALNKAGLSFEKR